MRITLLGPPGSGKGTQGSLIEQGYGFPKISTGDLLRRAVQNGTPLGIKVKASMNRGELASDEIVIQMVAERIAAEDCRKGYILDGFPRNINQAQRLEELENQHLEVALDIRLSEDALVQRLSLRRICSQCGNIFNLSEKALDRPNVCDTCQGELVQRPDDQPDVLRERLRVYRKETEPLVDYYKRRDIYHRIDGEKTIEAVFQDIRLILDAEIVRNKQTEAVR